MLTPSNDASVNHFSGCPGGEGNAVISGEGAPRAHYQPVVDVFQSFSRKQLGQRQKRLNHEVDELSLQFSDASKLKKSTNPWRLDLFPVVLPKDEWKRISAGIVQRALAFNAYVADMYGDQQVLRQRVIPHELALRDPALLRQLNGIEVPHGEYSQFGAFDLVDVGGGNWKVSENHMGTPFGISHVLQNRRVLSAVFPELYEEIDVAPVASFSTHLLEMLRAQSPRKNPHVLLLTNENTGQAYFEESFIARHMGISIAQPKDLLVRESRVFLRTIRGLEPVDVIYRRIESSALDPIAMPNRWARGVPGLINVVRKGNVAIVNAPGVGVADNRALLRYSDRLIKHYLKEKPILETVETYHLDDVDQRTHVWEHSEEMVIKPVQDHDILWQQLGGKRPSGTSASMRQFARKYPEYFVAQKFQKSSEVPYLKNGHFVNRGMQLRAYYILGAEPIVLPGGMARQTSATHRTRRLSIVSSGLKDVLVKDDLVEKLAPKRRATASGSRFSIGSRVAESLYWVGRYIERAENTARQFNILEKLRWDQLAHTEQRSYWPLLQAVAAATGQQAVAKLKKPPSDTLELSSTLLLDSSKGASVTACLGSARNGLENVRESISPEVLEVIEEMMVYLRQEAKKPVTRARLRQISERIVSEVARFNGTAERTLSHDDAWHFLRIGRFYERAVGTMSVLEVALPRIMKTYREHDSESAELTALLRLLGSLDAYRREFRSRAYLDRVSRLIVLGDTNPSSVMFCLHNLHYAIGTLSINGDRELGHQLQKSLDQLMEELKGFTLIKVERTHADFLDIEESGLEPLEVDAQKIAVEMAELTKEIEGFHKQIEDVFFNHQNVFAQDPMLFDLE
ncbi:circularly permuted type 2 ATP-grasp protein [Rubritalea spongiae]|uniref:Circularly permuted type 2 ATP-grasp protein n=1 Tax=Rubritalea spongiae TaxID=430797 RepID=A0ABW5DZH3_9BACT